MYETREKIYWFAITSRILILVLQFVFNFLCPDHDAEAFKGVSDPNEKFSVFDNLVSVFFGGLTRWDAQYFIHIAKYGYTYENNLAFFPLFPFTIRSVALVLQYILLFLNFSNIIVISGIIINFVCFVKTALLLYDLTKLVFKDKRIAYRSAIFFCINPASIFFTALYTESMFTYLTFYCMLTSFAQNPCLFVSLSFSTLVRSNGLINLGFPIYSWLKDFLVNTIPNFMLEQKHFYSNNNVFLFNLRHIFISLAQILMTITLSIIPYYFLQVYYYTIFCTPVSNIELPIHIKKYAFKNNLLMPEYKNFSWCQAILPISYSSVQKEYWNVGFMKYYRYEQIPNFFLALPIFYFILNCIIQYCKEHKSKLFTFEFITYILKNEKLNNEKYPVEIFVFIVHGLILSLICIFFVHIQISTRFLCSASPLLYWFCAIESIQSNSKPSDKQKLNQILEFDENMSSKWKVFFITQKQYSIKEKVILGYFLSYYFIGCFMYSNFLPWT